MSLSILADVLHGPLIGRDAVFTGVSTDTRTLAANDLFIPLQGPRFDGHDFLAEAIAAGAAGAVLSRAINTPLAHVKVADTRRALSELAAFWRAQFSCPVIGVTGSNGKTTVKEMIGAVLAGRGEVCATRGNLNNEIGVPLTLLRLRAEHRYAVVEMGMNHRGEIERLSRLARPNVALINNAAEAHLEGLGSVQEVARAKGEIFAGLAADGTAIINADDAFFSFWRELAAPRRILTFGMERAADVRARYQPGARGYRIELTTPEGEIAMTLSLIGKHNAMNAAAATAASLAVGASLKDIAAGLERLRAISGRLELKEGISGARVIDDTYNANPGSLAAGLQVLKDYGGERVLVLGDMGELGEAAEGIHERVGELARQIGIQRLFALGDMSRRAAKRFGKGARHFKDPQALVEALIDCMHADMTVLIKGSRFMKMERVVAGILRRTTAGTTEGGA